MGTLYDMVETDGGINVQDRGASGTGHGWAGANQVFWNCAGASSICQNPWVSAKNYNFGFIGEKNAGWNSRPDGMWVGYKRPGIFPESLYQAQLGSRLNDRGVFSVYQGLEKVNDSTFILSFNMPFLGDLAIAKNFSITGNAGYEGAECSVTALSDTSIKVVVDGIGPLPAFSSVTVNAVNMLSSTGEALSGLTSATYIEPDLRPVVTGLFARVNNEDETLGASSSKPGSIYLVKFSGNYDYLDDYKTERDLDRAVTDNLGRKVDAPFADSVMKIATKGLPGGYYLYYGVDEDGRLSAPADEWPEVEATGPLSKIDDAYTIPDFSVWSSNGIIFINPGDQSAHYSVQFFDITGSLFNGKRSVAGDQQFILPDYRGIMIVKLIAEDGSGIGVYKLVNNPL